VAKLPAGSVALSVTVNVPRLSGVSHSSLGRPPSTVALLRHTTLAPWRIVMLTFETFESDICTPARVPPRSFVVSREMTGGVLWSVLKRWAVVQ
jgi:hypothetical protein